ncbi:MAG TPA: O-antigen ligase family protein [Pyrinomonadaceae bacterium]|nr:O-antigen ligase family protein [Pyrinomonadaceae bacterium]
MNKRRKTFEDYATVTRSRKSREAEPVAESPDLVNNDKPQVTASPPADNVAVAPRLALPRGHALSFALLFLFTLVLYGRPAEFYPSAATKSLALIIGVATLGLFVVTQLIIDGRLTARPPEVNYALLFLVTALLSIPLAIDPAVAWGEFTTMFVRAVLIFVVIVNVVRTPKRLKWMLALSVLTALVLSLQAMNDYRLGLNIVEGYRAAGRGTGIFGNTNDMALFLVTTLPISVGFFFGSKTGLMKVIHAACVAMMLFGIVLSYSRGAFLGVLVVTVFFALKIGKRSKSEVAALLTLGALAMIVLAPSGYGDRLLSILIPGLDPNGSADSRRGELFRSIYVALRHPLLGIGMGNYQPNMSYHGLVTHNSYTQVASEMGLLALYCYTMFIVTPIRKLAAIARQTFANTTDADFYYLALGLQASLIVFMVSSFFLSVAYAWNIYYLVGYAVCLRRIYESETGKIVVVEKRRKQTSDDQLIENPAHQPAIA